MIVELLTEHSVARYLREEHSLAAEPVAVREMSGGVSCVVLDVAGASQSWVVKQALERLRVEQEWSVTQERTLTEARALELVRRWTPEHVPAVIAVDPERYVLILERAPKNMTSWKSRLLQGDCRAAAAGTLGAVLGCWHRRSAEAPQEVELVETPGAFENLRVAPYYRAAAEAVPEAAGQINDLIDLMGSRRQCLVHGDFSPKNVLVGDGRVWVIDFEVAHRGDPDFDVAFLLTHLVAKAVMSEGSRPALETCASAFVARYHTAIEGSALAAQPETAAAHVGALLLARVYGKSPLEYLDDDARRRLAAAGRALLDDSSPIRAEIWSAAMTEAGFA